MNDWKYNYLIKQIQKSIIQAIEKESYEWLTIKVDNDGSITQE